MKYYKNLLGFEVDSEYPLIYWKLFDLKRRLEEIEPQVIFEMGTGYTTKIFDDYAKKTGATVYSIDENREYQEEFFKKLDIKLVNSIISPVTKDDIVETVEYKLLIEECDLLYVDGPDTSFSEIPYACLFDPNAEHVLYDIRMPSVIYEAENCGNYIYDFGYGFHQNFFGRYHTYGRKK